MPDGLADFNNDFFQEILAASGTEQRFQQDLFFERVTAQLMEAGELDSADREFYQGYRGVRIDGYGGDPAHSDGVLTIIISEFNSDPTLMTMTRVEMEAAFKRLRSFLEKSLDDKWRNALEETLPGYGLASLIASRWNDVNKVRLILITNKVLSSRVDGTADSALESRPVSHSVWDLSRLRKYVEAGHGREEIEIDLVKDFGGALPVLHAVSGEGSYEAYLSVVPAAQLAAIYDRWGARLLEQNVRVFLQARGGVNKGIRNTLINDPGMFFAYNNGITATAEGIETQRNEAGLQIIALKNLQIVNGGQTTASIHAVSRKGEGDLSKVSVQMKLSIIDPQDVQELVPKISEYANTQNKVSAADFFANHPYHVRIEGFSRQVWARSRDGGIRDTKWFYERARGQYQDARALLTPVQRKKFDLEYPNKAPNKQLITKTDLAKYLMVWEGKPEIVSLGAQKNFAKFAEQTGKDWGKDETVFNELYYKHAIAKALIFIQLDKIVATSKELDAQKANVVAYSISKLNQVVTDSGNVVDFSQVWSDQSMSPPLVQSLFICATEVNRVLTNPPPGSSNLTEWAKQQACWKRVQDLRFDLSSDFEKFLVTSATAKQGASEAKKVQVVDNGIEAQTETLQIGGPEWKKIRDWASQKGLVSPDDLGILDICVSIPGKIPTDRQSLRALAVRNRARDEGCPFLN